jgi:general secretion pathway protein D
VSPRVLLPLLCIALLAASAARAQTISPENRMRDGRVNIDFQDAPLGDVIKLMSEISQRNFLYDEAVARGTVTLISPEAVSVDEAYQVFESILQQKGFTTVEGPAGVTKIIPVRAAKESPIETVTGDQRAPNRDIYVTRLMSMSYVQAAAIAQAFRPLISKDANLIAYTPTNTLILTDTQANIRRMMTLLSQIDVETFRDRLKVIPVEYADAGEMVDHLRQIYQTPGSSGRGQVRSARARTQRAAAAQTVALEASGGLAAVGQPRFIPDRRTNSIILIAPQPTIEQVEKLVQLLDYKRQGGGKIHVYRLQNADAEDMAGTLAALTQGARRSGGATGVAAATAASAVANLQGEIQVTADAPTNSLIIQASPEGFAALRDVIEALDVRRPQVMIEALILEVNVTDGTQLGVGWLYQPEQNSQDGSTSSTGFGNVTPESLIGQIVNDPPSLVTAILGQTVTVFRDIDGDGVTEAIEVPVIQAAITAAQQDQDLNLISAPVLLTADNETARIVVGQNIPVPTTRLQTDSGGDDFTTSQNIERQDVGVTLRVTPQISEGDTVRLSIFQQISQVIGGDPTLGPTTTNREIENVVYVSDGEAVMIGGILDEVLTTTENKVPWLGDIPILGWAFKSTTESIRKLNLMLILTPHIVRDKEDLEQLTVEHRERFRDAAADDLTYSAEEREARRRALEAGVELPSDEHPVRRTIEMHTRNYPTESLPELRSQAQSRARERSQVLESAKQVVGGSYVVQVTPFRDSSSAVELLQKLLQLGYDGTILSREEGAETLHLVQLGPYFSPDVAQRVAREVGIETDRHPVVIVQP